jgi:integrase
VIAGYDPERSKVAVCTKAEWKLVAPLVRRAVGNLDVASGRGIRPYLTAMTRLSAWAHGQGLDLVESVVLSSLVIEAYVAQLEGSQGTYRAQLRRLAVKNGVQSSDDPREAVRGYGRRAVTEPYSLDEVRALLAFAAAQQTDLRRRCLTAFVLLGAGCGLSRGALRGVCRNDVSRHSGVPHVHVADRCVPVLPELHADFDRLVAEFESSGVASDEPFVGVTHAHQPN